MLFRFEVSALILSPYAYLIIAVLSSFEIQNVFVLENWNLWLYHDNRNANVFLSPGKDVTLFLHSYTALSLNFPQNSAKNLGRSDLCYCVKTSVSVLVQRFFQGSRHTCSQSSNRAPNETGLKNKSFFLEKESSFLSFNTAQTIFNQPVKKQKQVQEEKNVFCRVPRKMFSQILSFSKNFCPAVSFLPCAFIFYEKEVQLVVSTHCNCNNMLRGLFPFRFTTLNILTFKIFSLNIHRGKMHGINKVINLPTKAIQMSLP